MKINPSSNMPSGSFSYFIRQYGLKLLEAVIICILLYLSFYEFQNNDLITVKLGMSHFFSPRLVNITAILLPVIGLCSALAFVFFKNAWPLIPILLLFGGYTLYSTVLLINTGDNCGCANVLIDMDLRAQIAVGTIVIIAGSYVYKRRKALSTL